MNRAEIILENTVILEQLCKIVDRFEVGILTLKEMRDERKTNRYQEYLLKIPLTINSPMEDAFNFGI